VSASSNQQYEADDMKLKLAIVVASTRSGRIGPAIADWFLDIARRETDCDTELLDLKDQGLPIYDEPHHPATGRYEHDHTRRWSARVGAADAFVLVMPEYNAGPPPPLLNALNFLYREWTYKPVAFVSYGGVSGGLRAVQAVKPVLTALRVVPVVDGVVAPMVHAQLEDGRFSASHHQV
jgi:NAD(P)H-dependent FMN reductase